MARIDINLDVIKNSNVSVPRVVSGISGVKRDMGLLRWRIDAEVMNRRGVKEKMENIISELSKAEQSVNDIYIVTEGVINQYAESEQILSAYAQKFE
jgi:hypothetical protein